LIAAEQLIDQRVIVDIAVREFLARIPSQRRQVTGIAGVSEAIEVHDRRGLLRQTLHDKVGANESSAAGNDDRIRQKGLSEMA
jgi:hypothetical protein